ncbi:phosphate ABC transporter substrate-binding protein [Vibrio sp. 10N.286.49.B3]|uniref:phosphate ABC transporter substrate-binding protein n=1 Tax=Vibrio sp. 10N.286.49.B3 TaxID=1880855 RepID=UPI000C81B7E2|nr:phosphate ABC transporter substrate-binding protein [Vibrio sp. 10N.286.49.B3]PMH43266.1 phosphate ABC transporter substrate-binding protein [Vibrio sp. 10N.286.49.B3]
MLRVTLASLLALAISIPTAAAKDINIAGSTSVARVMDVLAEAYNQQKPEPYIAVQGIGSTAGITLVEKDIVDIGMSSRYLTERELTEEMEAFPIAFDGLAVVANVSNTITNLSREQLFSIYKGDIKNWKEVGGKDKPIAVVTREASSGSRYSFESLLGLTKIINNRLVSNIDPTNLVVNSNSMVKTIVNHNPHAIGFISTGSIDQSVKAITFEGIAPTAENISSGKYELSRPFLLINKKDKLNDDSKGFIKFLSSDTGRQLITEYGYIPVKNK